jgi:TonB-linked SusC/RagA family outer membrane protein
MKVPKKSGYAKLRLVMRIGMIQVTLALMCGGLSMAATNYAQLLDRNISISLSEIAFTEALKEIEARANISFVYSVDQLSDEMPVTLQATDKPLREILGQLLTPRHISYKVYEKDKTLSLKKQLPERQPDPKFRDRANTQTQNDRLEVSGTVTDAATQQPMPGVNILVKGTTAGTTTDATGRYALAAREDDVLIFSFIGYAAQEVPVRGRTVLDVALSEDIRNLNEVVVNAGYYTTTKWAQTGSIARVEAKDIEKQPVSNPIAAIIGRMPGVEIVQQTGVPGGNFKVRIRGTNSIANGNDPLYIIDGVPFMQSTMSFNETSGGILGNSNPGAGQGSSPLNSINPNDIESIEVLKDADATAIYGSRGSNGVILITTKKGKAGKTKIVVNMYSGVGTVPNKLSLLNTQQYLDMRKEAFINSNVTPTAGNARDLLLWDTTRYTDWQEVLIGGKANTSDLQLTISGGEKNTQFSVGAGYHRETTVFPGSNSDQRIATHMNLVNNSPNQKFKSSFTFNYAVNSTNLLREDLTRRALTLPPIAPPLYDQDGNLSWTNWAVNYENPMAFLHRRYEATTTNLIGNAVLGYEILPNLEIKSSMGYTNAVMNAVTAIPKSSLDPVSASTRPNSSYFSNSNFKNWIIEPQLNWKLQVGKGRFNILAGTTFLEQTTEGIAQLAEGFASEALMKNLAAATTRTAGTNYYAQYRYHAIFGRINYSHKDKYMLNLTARRDGSSRFGPGKQFATFAAAGAAWIFSEENFLKGKTSALSFGKLRMSYGTTGNDQLGDYQYLDTYSFSSGQYQGNVGLAPVRLSNPEFAWEANKKMEAAIELGLWKDRMTTTVAAFRNRSSNQLVGYPLPPTTGFTSIQGNFPATVQNTGIEIDISVQAIERTHFRWNTSLNMTVPHNKLIDFPDLESSSVYANSYEVGKPLSIRKLYHFTGVDPTSGLYTVKDVNEDGIFNFDDRTSIRFVGQKFYSGLNNSIQYRGFQLDVFLQLVKQTGLDMAYFLDVPGLLSNQQTHVLDRWMQEGDDASAQRVGVSGSEITAFSRYTTSDQIVVDASFLRLRNVSLSYSVPQKWISKILISDARIYFLAQNLLTITRYNGLDPEFQNAGLPPLRVLTGGLSLTF